MNPTRRPQFEPNPEDIRDLINKKIDAVLRNQKSQAQETAKSITTLFRNELSQQKQQHNQLAALYHGHVIDNTTMFSQLITRIVALEKNLERSQDMVNMLWVATGAELPADLIPEKLVSKVQDPDVVSEKPEIDWKLKHNTGGRPYVIHHANVYYASKTEK